jgi:murein L,D-transpeptidase YafK
MDPQGMKRLEREAAQDPTLMSFWRNLKEGYDLFETRHRLPTVTVDRQGRYVIK